MTHRRRITKRAQQRSQQQKMTDEDENNQPNYDDEQPLTIVSENKEQNNNSDSQQSTQSAETAQKEEKMKKEQQDKKDDKTSSSSPSRQDDRNSSSSSSSYSSSSSSSFSSHYGSTFVSASSTLSSTSSSSYSNYSSSSLSQSSTSSFGSTHNPTSGLYNGNNPNNYYPQHNPYYQPNQNYYPQLYDNGNNFNRQPVVPIYVQHRNVQPPSLKSIELTTVVQFLYENANYRLQIRGEPEKVIDLCTTPVIRALASEFGATPRQIAENDIIRKLVDMAVRKTQINQRTIALQSSSFNADDYKNDSEAQQAMSDHITKFNMFASIVNFTTKALQDAFKDSIKGRMRNIFLDNLKAVQEAKDEKTNLPYETICYKLHPLLQPYYDMAQSTLDEYLKTLNTARQLQVNFDSNNSTRRVHNNNPSFHQQHPNHNQKPKVQMPNQTENDHLIIDSMKDVQCKLCHFKGHSKRHCPINSSQTIVANTKYATGTVNIPSKWLRPDAKQHQPNNQSNSGSNRGRGRGRGGRGGGFRGRGRGRGRGNGRGYYQPNQTHFVSNGNNNSNANNNSNGNNNSNAYNNNSNGNKHQLEQETFSQPNSKNMRFEPNCSCSHTNYQQQQPINYSSTYCNCQSCLQQSNNSNGYQQCQHGNNCNCHSC